LLVTSIRYGLHAGFQHGILVTGLLVPNRQPALLAASMGCWFATPLHWMLVAGPQHAILDS